MREDQERAAERLESAFKACQKASLSVAIWDGSVFVWPKEFDPQNAGDPVEEVQRYGKIFFVQGMWLDGGAAFRAATERTGEWVESKFDLPGGKPHEGAIIEVETEFDGVKEVSYGPYLGKDHFPFAGRMQCHVNRWRYVQPPTDPLAPTRDDCVRRLREMVAGDDSPYDARVMREVIAELQKLQPIAAIAPTVMDIPGEFISKWQKHLPQQAELELRAIFAAIGFQEPAIRPVACPSHGDSAGANPAGGSSSTVPVAAAGDTSWTENLAHDLDEVYGDGHDWKNMMLIIEKNIPDSPPSERQEVERLKTEIEFEKATVKSRDADIERLNSGYWSEIAATQERVSDKYWKANRRLGKIIQRQRMEIARLLQVAAESAGKIRESCEDWGAFSITTRPVATNREKLLAIAERLAAGQPAESVVPQPIPSGVYFSVEHNNFYDQENHGGMGQLFFAKWSSRYGEFPGRCSNVPSQSAIASILGSEPEPCGSVAEAAGKFADRHVPPAESVPSEHPDRCPTTGESDCQKCSGEFCETHGVDPCDCDTADRHIYQAGNPSPAADKTLAERVRLIIDDIFSGDAIEWGQSSSDVSTSLAREDIEKHMLRHLSGVSLPEAEPAAVLSWEPAARLCEDLVKRIDDRDCALTTAAAEIRNLPVLGGKRSVPVRISFHHGKMIVYQADAKLSSDSLPAIVVWDDPAPEPPKPVEVDLAEMHEKAYCGAIGRGNILDVIAYAMQLEAQLKEGADGK